MIMGNMLIIVPYYILWRAKKHGIKMKLMKSCDALFESFDMVEQLLSTRLSGGFGMHHVRLQQAWDAREAWW